MCAIMGFSTKKLDKHEIWEYFDRTLSRGPGYYVKIVRPKQQAEDDAEFEDDGYGEGFDPDEAYGEPEYLSEDDFDDKDSK